MNQAFIFRDPTAQEIERFRLVLSTYQDGSGQLIKGIQSLPGWRDFERSFAACFNGIPQENKFLFDVLIPNTLHKGFYWGVSCKMRGTLSDTNRTHRVTIELSNSAGKFWRALEKQGLNQQNYKTSPKTVGECILDEVETWLAQVKDNQPIIRIDVGNSFYLALSWNKDGYYQLFKFPMDLPVKGISWDFPIVKTKDAYDQPGRRLRGRDQDGVLYEWYGESGGQLKYYPLVENALWKSEQFKLEPLPKDNSGSFGLFAKAQSYFPNLWNLERK